MVSDVFQGSKSSFTYQIKCPDMAALREKGESGPQHYPTDPTDRLRDPGQAHDSDESENPSIGEILKTTLGNAKDYLQLGMPGAKPSAGLGYSNGSFRLGPVRPR